MQVHLVDGTYELFRQHFAVPSAPGPRRHRGRGDPRRRRLGADDARGRRDPPRRRDRPRHRVVPQRPLGRLQDERRASTPSCSPSSRCSRTRSRRSGVAVWAMVEVEADDALASAAAVAAADDRVEQAIICTPDKDLGQCVGGKVVQLDRRKHDDPRRRRRASRSSACRPSRSPTTSRSWATPPTASPGSRAWARSRRPTVLARYGHIEAIPDAGEGLGRRRARRGEARDRRSPRSARSPTSSRCSRRCATDADVGTVDDWRWTGPDAELRRRGPSASARRGIADAGRTSSPSRGG